MRITDRAIIEYEGERYRCERQVSPRDTISHVAMVHRTGFVIQKESDPRTSFAEYVGKTITAIMDPVGVTK